MQYAISLTNLFVYLFILTFLLSTFAIFVQFSWYFLATNAVLLFSSVAACVKRFCQQFRIKVIWNLSNSIVNLYFVMLYAIQRLRAAGPDGR